MTRRRTVTPWPTVRGTFARSPVAFCAQCQHPASAHYGRGRCRACDRIDDRYELGRQIDDLEPAIDWLWSQLRDCGATKRNGRAVSMRDAEGNDSEDAVIEAWAAWRVLVYRRQRLRERLDRT